MMVAQVTGLTPHEFIHTLGDAHLYLNHLEQAQTQISRTPMPPPRLRLAPKRDLFAFTEDDIAFEGYRAHPKIDAPIAV
jgi:thymidylate synthase